MKTKGGCGKKQYYIIFKSWDLQKKNDKSCHRGIRAHIMKLFSFVVINFCSLERKMYVHTFENQTDKTT